MEVHTQGTMLFSPADDNNPACLAGTPTIAPIVLHNLSSSIVHVACSKVIRKKLLDSAGRLIRNRPITKSG